MHAINPLSAKFIKWSNTFKQIVGKLPTICLSVFDHFSGLAFKGLRLNVGKKKTRSTEAFAYFQCFNSFQMFKVSLLKNKI